MADFEAIVRDERPEEDQNPVLIRELATIKFNYYLTTFKEIFNDVIEERKRIVNERLRTGTYVREIYSRDTVNRIRTDDLRKSTSQNVL